jgi:phosphoserine phosphatase RsbU/P
MAFLITNTDSDVSHKIELKSDATLIGRHPDCQVLVDDTSVSRKHAQIVYRDSEYWLEDLRSRNGTYLNNHQIQQITRLYDGDLIRVCDVQFEFALEDIENGHQQRATLDCSEDDAPSQFILDDRIPGDVSSIMSRLDVSSHYGRETNNIISAERRLEILIEITRSLAKTVGLNAILENVLECLFRLFDHVERGFIVLKEEELLKPLAMKIRHQRDEERIRLSRTIVDHVMETQQAIVSADATADSRFNMSQSIADFRIRSILCAPLIDSDGLSIGVIQLDALRHGVGFREEDLEILTTVAIQSSIAIDNALLHEKELKQRELQRDLELANEVQRSMLPQRRLQIEGLQFYDYYRSAHQVGGDYFDYIRLPRNRVAIVVADVVGHGIAAALLMAKFSAEVRFALASEVALTEIVGHLNRSLMSLHLDRFVTMALAIFDYGKSQVSMVNAGHMQPIIRDHTGSVSQVSLDYSGMPLGIVEDAKYPIYKVPLNRGDVIILYTDGISDALDHNGQPYGINRIVEVVQSAEDTSPESICKTIVRHARQHMGKEEQPDDICVVAFGMCEPVPSETAH